METIQNLSNIIVEFYEKLSNWEQAVVAESGLSLPQMHTVEILGISGPLKMKELAQKLGITTGTLTLTIDNLEKKEIVMRKANPEDRRSYVIELTQKGQAIQEKHSDYHLQLTKECSIGLTEEEQKQFLHLMLAFMQNL